jgi:hypothetical protein
MPARHERYLKRNEEIGCVAVYDISIIRPKLARTVLRFEDGREMPIEDGTRAKVVDAFDFDWPYMYELPDGTRTRAGGSGWHHYRTNAEADDWHGKETRAERKARRCL